MLLCTKTLTYLAFLLLQLCDKIKCGILYATLAWNSFFNNVTALFFLLCDGKLSS